ncbi:MAG TPA: AAA family ATPase [Thermoanaerobaculia bacterium]|nr:AAA family ATPase [Thermoanaerobaculia bacterium]
MGPAKVAFIGSHGVGKTTLCYGVAARLKARDIGVELVQEVARRCPLPINEQTSVASESWILLTQVAEELIAQARYPVVLCDRSVLDNYVYLLLAAGRQESLEGLVGHWLGTYDLLLHVPIVDRPNPDGIRSGDPAFQRAVEERLRRELAERRIKTLRLDPENRSLWVDTVEQEIWRLLRPAQLPLL